MQGQTDNQATATPLHLRDRVLRYANSQRRCMHCFGTIRELERYVVVDEAECWHRDCYRTQAGRSQRHQDLRMMGLASAGGQPRRGERSTLIDPKLIEEESGA